MGRGGKDWSLPIFIIFNILKHTGEPYKIVGSPLFEQI